MIKHFVSVKIILNQEEKRRCISILFSSKNKHLEEKTQDTFTAPLVKYLQWQLTTDASHIHYA
jgi:hypothetical protein